jgi:hypothetical protein
MRRSIVRVVTTLGPRARRRLIGVAACVAVIGGITVALFSTHPSHRPSEAASARFIYANRDLRFGMNRSQVRRISGPPTATKGDCWLFRPRGGMVGSISMGAPGSIAARSSGALKLCFYVGSFSSAYRHIFYGGRWKWVEWSPVLTIEPATPPS